MTIIFSIFTFVLKDDTFLTFFNTPILVIKCFFNESLLSMMSSLKSMFSCILKPSNVSVLDEVIPVFTVICLSVFVASFVLLTCLQCEFCLS